MRIADIGRGQIAKPDAENGGRQQDLQARRVVFAAIGEETGHVHGDEDGQHDAGRLHRGNDKAHHRHAEQRQRSAEAALGETDEDHRRNGEGIEERIGDGMHGAGLAERGLQGVGSNVTESWLGPLPSKGFRICGSEPPPAPPFPATRVSRQAARATYPGGPCGIACSFIRYIL
jgi:hypothetical protein